LRQALNSVFSQEGLGEAFHTEVIVVDDGSTDETAEVVRAHGAVRYLRHEVNRGASAARNAGLAAAGGQYVAFLDDDDLWLPHKLRVQVDALSRDPSVGLVYSQVLVQTRHGDFVWPSFTPEGSVLQVLLRTPFLNMDAVLLRREVLDAAGRFDEDLRFFEDTDFWLRVVAVTRVRYVRGVVAVYRLVADQGWARLALRGEHEPHWLHVMERGLRLLPHRDDRVVREVLGGAHLWCAQSKVGLGETRDVGDHLEKAVRVWPPLIWSPRVLSLVRDIGRVASERVGERMGDLLGVARVTRAVPRDWREALRARRLEAEMWAAAGRWLTRRSPTGDQAALALYARAARACPWLLYRSEIRRSLAVWIRTVVRRAALGRVALLVAARLKRGLAASKPWGSRKRQTA
jgi:glycosyltransferase involved in cell wall biosynthesis